LSVCDVWTAARVIRSYAEDFRAAPAVVNLVEAPAPTRAELAARQRAVRPDLRVVWIPGIALRAVSAGVKFASRLLRRGSEPLDVYSAFAAEAYNTELAAAVIERAGPSAIPLAGQSAPAVQAGS
jgi:hypothetical protein